MILFYFEGIGKIPIQRKKIKNCIYGLIKEEGKVIGNISIIFCSDKYLLDLNYKYLKHNYLTDVITFNYCSGDIISGDIFVSMERISDNAQRFSDSVINEVNRVIFHGILHLIGYDDKTGEEKIQMKERENFYLKKYS